MLGYLFRVLARIGRGRTRPGAGRRNRPLLEQLEAREVPAIAAEEQLFVYLLNRARHDPVAYQQENNLPVNLSYVSPRQPLAVNDLLFNSTGFKVNDMVA